MSRNKSVAVLITTAITALAAVAVITTSTPASASTTIRFTDTLVSSRGVEMDIYVGSGVDRSQGEVVGYSAVRWVTGDDGFNMLEGTFALQGGRIHFRATRYYPDPEVTSRGRITGGTGAYGDARGAITLRPVDDDTTRIRITYRTG
jgi:hypothetical protein